MLQDILSSQWELSEKDALIHAKHSSSDLVVELEKKGEHYYCSVSKGDEFPLHSSNPVASRDSILIELSALARTANFLGWSIPVDTFDWQAVPVKESVIQQSSVVGKSDSKDISSGFAGMPWAGDKSENHSRFFGSVVEIEPTNNLISAGISEGFYYVHRVSSDPEIIELSLNDYLGADTFTVTPDDLQGIRIHEIVDHASIATPQHNPLIDILDWRAIPENKPDVIKHSEKEFSKVTYDNIGDYVFHGDKVVGFVESTDGVGRNLGKKFKTLTISHPVEKKNGEVVNSVSVKISNDNDAKPTVKYGLHCNDIDLFLAAQNCHSASEPDIVFLTKISKDRAQITAQTAGDLLAFLKGNDEALHGKYNWLEMAFPLFDQATQERLKNDSAAYDSDKKLRELLSEAYIQATGVDPTSDLASTAAYANAIPTRNESLDSSDSLKPIIPVKMMDGEVFAEMVDEFDHLFNNPAETKEQRSIFNDVKDLPYLSTEEAAKRIDEWVSVAKNQYRDKKTRSDNSSRVIVSLFDHTGNWSRPYEEAGYTVLRFDLQDGHDILEFSAEYLIEHLDLASYGEVYGVLAACPCTDFANCGSRHWAEKDARGDTEISRELVYQTLRTVELLSPKMWVIENPVGRIESLTGLPKYRLSFNPNHFGSDYTKHTLLWGQFETDLPIANADPVKGSKMHTQYGGKSLATKNARSETPLGFAYAFFAANNYHDLSPTKKLQYDYRELAMVSQNAIGRGVTEGLLRQVYSMFEVEQQFDEICQLVASIAKLINEGVEPDLISSLCEIESQWATPNIENLQEKILGLFGTVVNDHVSPKERQPDATGQLSLLMQTVDLDEHKAQIRERLEHADDSQPAIFKNSIGDRVFTVMPIDDTSSAYVVTTWGSSGVQSENKCETIEAVVELFSNSFDQIASEQDLNHLIAQGIEQEKLLAEARAQLLDNPVQDKNEGLMTPWENLGVAESEDFAGSVFDAVKIDGSEIVNGIVTQIDTSGNIYWNEAAGGTRNVLRKNEIKEISVKNICHFKHAGERILNNGKSWSIKSSAAAALRSMGLSETHFVDGHGGGSREYWIEPKPRLHRRDFNTVSLDLPQSEDGTNIAYPLSTDGINDVHLIKDVCRHYDWLSIRKIELPINEKGKQYCLLLNSADKQKLENLFIASDSKKRLLTPERSIREQFNRAEILQGQRDQYALEFEHFGRVRQAIVVPGRTPSAAAQMKGYQKPLTIYTLKAGRMLSDSPQTLIAEIFYLNGKNVLTVKNSFPLTADSELYQTFLDAKFDIPCDPEGQELESSADNTAGYDVDTTLRIAADSWDKLRAVDVYRVLDAAAEQSDTYAIQVFDRMVQKRPDLKAEASGALKDIGIASIDANDPQPNSGEIETEAPTQRIDDVGYVAGARKELYKTNDYLQNLRGDTDYSSLNAAIPKPDCEKLIDEGLSPVAVSFALCIREIVGRKPLGRVSKERIQLWRNSVDSVKETIALALDGATGGEDDQFLLDIAHESGLAGTLRNRSIPKKIEYIATLPPQYMSKAASIVEIEVLRGRVDEYELVISDRKVKYEFHRAKPLDQVNAHFYTSIPEMSEASRDAFCQAIDKVNAVAAENRGKIKIELYEKQGFEYRRGAGFKTQNRFVAVLDVPDQLVGTEDEWLDSVRDDISSMVSGFDDRPIVVGNYRKSINTFFAGYKPPGGKVQVVETLPNELQSSTKLKRLEWIDANLDRLVKKVNEIRSTKIREDENSTRIGPDYRKGQNITPEQLQAEFGLHAVQFGTSTLASQKQAQIRVNETYDALHDLAGALGISPRSIGLGGGLSIAFGARGKGGKSKGGVSTNAHFETAKIAINLTKNNGAGSLAHEWWHAFDNYVAKLEVYEPEEAGQKVLHGFATDKPVAGKLRDTLQQAFSGLLDAVSSPEYVASSTELDGMIGGKSPYWSKNIEMSARAFEAYLKHLLTAKGQRNEFLVNVRSGELGLSGVVPSLEGLEKYGFAESFNRLFESILTKEGEHGDYLYKLESASSPAVYRAHKAETVRQWISKVQSDTGVAIQVVADEHELPPCLRAVLPASAAGVFDMGSGIPYVIADRIRNQDHAIKTALHEGLGHSGVLSFLQRNSEAGGHAVELVLDEIFDGIGPRAIQKVVRGYTIDYKTAAGRREAVLEYIAHLAETGRKPQVVGKAVVSTLDLVENLYDTVGWSERDVLTLIEASRVFALRNAVERAGNGKLGLEERLAARELALHQAMIAAGGRIDRLLAGGQHNVAYHLAEDYASRIQIPVLDAGAGVEYYSNSAEPAVDSAIFLSEISRSRLMNATLAVSEQSEAIKNSLKDLGVYDDGLARAYRNWVTYDGKLTTYPGDSAKEAYDIGQASAASLVTLVAERCGGDCRLAVTTLNASGVYGMQHSDGMAIGLCLFDETFGGKVVCQGQQLNRDSAGIARGWLASYGGLSRTDPSTGATVERAVLTNTLVQQHQRSSVGSEVPEYVTKLLTRASRSSRLDNLLYRKALGLPESGHTVSMVKEWISSVEEYTSVNIRVVPSRDQLPPRLQASIDGDAAGLYDGRTRTPYLIANRIQDEEHAVKTALHEGLGHAGIIHYLKRTESIGGLAVNEVLEDIYESLGHEMTSIVSDYGIDVSTPEGRAEATLEYLAFTTEKQSQVGDLHRAMTQLLEDAHGDLNWTKADIANLIEASRLNMAIARQATGKTSSLHEAYEQVLMANGRRLEKLLNKNRKHVVWHGSPFAFSRFDLENVDSGEGAQAYGYGLYFASKESVGRFYERSLGRDASIVQNGGVEISRLNDRMLLLQLDNEDSTQAVELYLKCDKSWEKAHELAVKSELSESVISEIKRLEKHIIPAGRGSLYRVEIDSDAGEFLDFDKPICEQSPRIKAFFEQYRRDLDYSLGLDQLLPPWKSRYLAEVRANGHSEESVSRVSEAIDEIVFRDDTSTPAWSVINHYKAISIDPNDMHDMRDEAGRGRYGQLYRGEEAYYDLINIGAAENDSAVSKLMSENGIIGVKYVDGESRYQVGEEDYNYVIFDDANVKVVVRENVGANEAQKKIRDKLKISPDVPVKDISLIAPLFWERTLVEQSNAVLAAIGALADKHGLDMQSLVTGGDVYRALLAKSGIIGPDNLAGVMYSAGIDGIVLDAGDDENMQRVNHEIRFADSINLQHCILDSVDRKAQAKSLGFDTDTVYYHGSRSGDISGFNPLNLVHYFTPNTNYGYIQHSDNVYPVYLRMKAPYYADSVSQVEQARSNPEFVSQLKAQGFDAIVWQHPTKPWLGASGWGDDKAQVAVFDTSQIRSVHAQFDPEFAAAGGILLRKEKVDNWIAGSKAVLSDGSPGVYYHGTDADFDEFKPSREGNFGSGIYFFSQKTPAEQFGEKTVEVNLSIKNPWYVSADWDSELSYEYDFESPSIEAVLSLPGGQDLVREARNGSGLYGSQLQSLLRDLGYDGIIARHPDRIEEVVVFNTDQVRVINENDATKELGANKALQSDETEYQAVDFYTTWYHGTLKDIKGPLQAKSTNSMFGRGVYLTSDPDDAARYASPDPAINIDLGDKAYAIHREEGIAYQVAKASLIENGGHIMPLHAKVGRTLTLDDRGLSVDGIPVDLDDDALVNHALVFSDMDEDHEQFKQQLKTVLNAQDYKRKVLVKNITGDDAASPSRALHALIRKYSAGGFVRSLAITLNASYIELRDDAVPSSKAGARHLIALYGGDDLVSAIESKPYHPAVAPQNSLERSLAQIGDTKVCNEYGEPIVVYRGQHRQGMDGAFLETAIASFSFGSNESAGEYAMTPNDQNMEAKSPAVMPAYLSIQKPFVNCGCNPEAEADPFIDIGDVALKLNLSPEETFELARFGAEYIYGTSNWEEIEDELECSSVDELIQTHPERVKDLYFELFVILDDRRWVQRIKDAGFDGAIYGGSGLNALEPEYRIFDASQAIPALLHPDVASYRSPARDNASAKAMLDTLSGYGFSCTATQECVVMDSDDMGVSFRVQYPATEAVNGQYLSTTKIDVVKTGAGGLNGSQMALIACEKLKELPVDLVTLSGDIGIPELSQALHATGFRSCSDVSADTVLPLTDSAKAVVELRDNAPRFMFVGPSSRAVAIEEYMMAYLDLKESGDSQSIWKNTGWFQGADGAWRFEISDREASLNLDRIKEMESGVETLGEARVPIHKVLNHPELFEHYPELRDGWFVLRRKADTEATLASYTMDRSQRHIITIYGVPTEATASRVLSSVLHEVQHAVQSIEGFSYGSTPELTPAVEYVYRQRVNELNGRLKPFIEKLDLAQRDESFYGALARFKGFEADALNPELTRKASQVYGSQLYAMHATEIIREIGVAPPARKRFEHNAYLVNVVRILGLKLSQEFEQTFGTTISEELNKVTEAGQDVVRLYRNATARCNRAHKNLQIERQRLADRSVEQLQEVENLSEYDVYTRVAGEVEARNTQTRQLLTPEERREIHPLETQDTPSAKQFFVKKAEQINALEALDRYAASVASQQGINMPIHVVETRDDLPEKIRREADSYGNQGVAGAYHEGEMYLVAEELSSPLAVEAALLHEAAHAGVETVFGNQMCDTYGAFWLAAGGAEGILEASRSVGIDMSAYLQVANEQLSEGLIGRQQYIAMLVDEFIAHASLGGRYRDISWETRSSVQEYFASVRSGAEDSGLHGLALAKASELVDVLKLVSEASRSSMNVDLTRPRVIAAGSEPMKRYQWQKKFSKELQKEHQLDEFTIHRVFEQNHNTLYKAFSAGFHPVELAGNGRFVESLMMTDALKELDRAPMAADEGINSPEF